MEPPAHDRRKHIRVKIVAIGATATPAVQRPFTLRDLSLGGCSVESLSAFRTGDRQTLELTTAGGDVTIVVTGEARYCRRINYPDGRSSFLAGFEFGTLTQDQRRVLELMLRGE
jgi:hypothetical protein